ncbi:extracellular solute-binding protein [Paenibacillus agricola]|uniref:Extracellular solute-binding protein n=1 Tax=Paenibacillus agricola TaxID=2716264 RepID=A0ABX0J5H1_9BACL|nr:extracellular solute-binding protein [Paenibacillus agricola]NHN30409.1 extracellular solute-binding protein [Paenibacillus agricola]
MNKNVKRSLWLLTTSLMTSSLVLAACSKDSSPVSSTPKANEATASGPVTYPIKTDIVLTHWYAAGAQQLGVIPDATNWPIFQELAKRTGIKEKYVSPAVNQAKEQLNVMFASGEYTDIIEWNFLNDYPGGPEKAIKDGNILKLNDLIDKHAPNLKKYLKAHPEVDKQIKTDNGTYYGFPFIRGDDWLKTYGGPIIRKDWLDDLGLQVPTTIDEWYVVLKAFKEKKGATAPLTFKSGIPRVFDDLSSGAFIGAYGVTRGFAMKDGKVYFGPAQPGYKEFLATMRKWYAEGLLDKDIATIDGKIQDANMTSGKSGATFALAGGGIGKWLGAMKDKDPKYNVIGAPYPVLKKGDVPMFGQKDYTAPSGGNFAVSPKSKNQELAVQLLDYGYSEEGATYFNFGTRGVSYDMKNNYPTYSEMVKSNYSLNLGLYTRSTGGPTIQDKRYYEQFAALPQQSEAVTTWFKTDVDKYQLPPISPTPEESSELAKIMTEVNTLVDETTIKIVLGTDPVDSYDKFLEKLKSLKIDRALQIEQAALDRYNKR